MNWRRAGIAAAFVVPVVYIFSRGMKTDPREIPSPLPGNPAPPFALSVFADRRGALVLRPTVWDVVGGKAQVMRAGLGRHRDPGGARSADCLHAAG